VTTRTANAAKKKELDIMLIRFKEQGSDRKPLAKAIETATGRKGQYCMQGEMRYAYDFGDGLELHRDGTLKGADSDLITALKSAGFTPETEEYDEPQPEKRRGIMDIIVEHCNENGVECERLHSAPQMECGDGHWRNLDGTFAETAPTEPTAEVTEEEQAPTETAADTITIEIPFTSTGDLTKATENLKNLIGGKATLIKQALGEDGTGDLPIEFTESTVKFEWLRFGTETDVINAWTAFLVACVKTAKKGQRFNANDTGLPENQKFTFRVFLVKIGLNDKENKANRKNLIRLLSGDSAFATPESKAKWLAKHGSKSKTEVPETENSALS
jgi:hypothetical protein